LRDFLIILYEQFLTTDGSILEIVTHSAEEFLHVFFEELQILLRHSLIAVQQSAFQNDLRLALNTNEYIVLCDFAEDYPSVLEGEVK
jgi:hypothetical protein